MLQTRAVCSAQGQRAPCVCGVSFLTPGHFCHKLTSPWVWFLPSSKAQTSQPPGPKIEDQNSSRRSRWRIDCYSDDLKAKGLSWLYNGKFVLSIKFV